jgi:cell division protein FtsL
MFDNLFVVIVIIIVLWAVGFGIYFYANRQQVDLDKEITSLKTKLDEDETHETD